MAEDIVATTEPPGGMYLELMMRARPVTLVCVGLLQQSRRAVEAIMTLLDAGLGDTAWGHIRTVFENTVTASWLLRDDGNLAKFMGDQRKHMTQSVQYEGSLQEWLDHFDPLMDRWVGHHRNDSMPGLRNRLTADTARAYVIYKVLSAYAHASAMSSTMQFALGDDDELILAEGAATDDDANLGFVASLTCIAGMGAYEELGDGAVGPLKELHEELMDAWWPGRKTNRAPVIHPPQLFVDDDDGYLRWVRDHPDGFVVNAYRQPTPSYLVLHRANCTHITTPRRSAWTKDYSKTCDTDKARLESWVEKEVGGTVRGCSSCAP